MAAAAASRASGAAAPEEAVLHTFFARMDNGDWKGCAATLAPEVACGFAGPEPATLKAAEVVAKFADLLSGYDRVQHYILGAVATEGSVCRYQCRRVLAKLVDPRTAEALADPFAVEDMDTTTEFDADNRIVSHKFTVTGSTGSPAVVSKAAKASVPAGKDYSGSGLKGRNVLVMGATGKTGRPIVEALQRDGGAAGAKVYAAVRREDAAKEFAAAGVATRHLDLDDPASFDAALEGIDSVFLVTGYSVDMLTQGKRVIDACVRAGVSHIVKLSTFHPAGSPCDNLVVIFHWHRLLEAYIESKGCLKYTHLRPNCFMQNFAFFTKKDEKKCANMMGPGPLGWLDTRDISDLATAIFRDPASHFGKVYYLSFEVAPFDDLVAIVAEESGEPYEALEVPVAPAPPEADAYFKQSIRGLVTDGKIPDMGSVRGAEDFERITGNKPRDFRAFVRDNMSLFK